MSPQVSSIVVDKSADHAEPHSICFLLQYQRQRKCFLFSECDLKNGLRDTSTRAALSGLLSTTANYPTNQIARLVAIVVKNKKLKVNSFHAF